jgi:hypothetical protein
MKYVIVYHKWFIDSLQWEDEIIECASLKRAKEIASLKCKEKKYSWDLNHWDYHVIPIEENDILKVKLTFRERIKGIIKLESSIVNLKKISK